ncbi:MAG TPA: hypothetical protein PLA08_01110 [Candidatus Cloacimonadota bacterium]|nr:hypothetical protein [Candidatus Cloacimonadota bacterium]
MRQIKDSMSREQYINIKPEMIAKYKNRALGIRDTILEIVEFVKANNLQVFTMNKIHSIMTGETYEDIRDREIVTQTG